MHIVISELDLVVLVSVGHFWLYFLKTYTVDIILLARRPCNSVLII